MPAPFTLHAEALPCDRVAVVAEAADPKTPVWIAVDDVRVAEGRGSLSWEGPAFAHRDVAVVSTGSHRKEQSFSIVAPREPWIEFDVPARAREGQISARIASETACPGLSWRITADLYDGRPPSVFAGVFPTEALALPIPEGIAHLSAELLANGKIVASATRDVWVDHPCVDDDGDGACADSFDLDCDDANAAVRPGLADVPGDGLDNDCDGKLAGDADRDGFDTARDCDDGDPTVHPGAIEADNDRDDDCDGRIVGERRLSVREDDGALEVRDRDHWRRSSVLPQFVNEDGVRVCDTFDLADPVVVPGGPERAWLVVVGCRNYRTNRWVYEETARALVLRAEGDGLALAADAPLPGSRFVRSDPISGAVRREGSIARPRVTGSGFALGDQVWTWRGDHLAP